MTRATFTAPEGVDGIRVTADLAPWVFGPFSDDIIAADTVPHRFRVFRLTVIETDADNSELELYKGPDDEAVATIPIPRATGGVGVVIPVITANIAANSRVRARFRDASVRPKTCLIKISCTVEATPGYRNHNAR